MRWSTWRPLSSIRPNSLPYMGPSPSNADLLTHIYQNVLHRTPDANGYAFWLDVLNRNAVSRAQVLAEFSESPRIRRP
jgi:hypothetical protein